MAAPAAEAKDSSWPGLMFSPAMTAVSVFGNWY